MIVSYLGYLLIIPLILIWRQKSDLNSKLTTLLLSEAELKKTIEERERSFKEKMALIEETKEKLSDSFKAISKETLEGMQKKTDDEWTKKEQTFLSKTLTPVKESLSRLDDGMRAIEKERKGEKEQLKEHLKTISESEQALRKETSNLVKALRKPDVRGMWGEMQLKRVVELAGMLNHCDFYEQKVEKSDDQIMRPDLIIRLPGGKQIIVDAKAPFEAFLEANQTEDQDKKEDRLKAHARHLRSHMMALSKKKYWQKFQPTPEFVVLFLPAEIFFSAALQYDPTLIEAGAELGVVFATPTTLIGLLRSIAYGWKQDTFTEHAKEIADLAKELYKRLSDMGKHWSSVGRNLTNAVDGYNKAIGSFERRVLVSARKLKEYGAATDHIDLDPIEFIDKVPRQVENQTLEIE